MKKVEIIKNEIRMTGHPYKEIKTLSIGSGQWALEVYGQEGFMFELIGSNGTHEKPDDLWGHLNKICRLAGNKF